MLEFLAENQSPFMVDVYPYYAYRDSSANVSLDYTLFQSSSEVIDPNTGLFYANMFDAQIAATPDNAQTYNTNLIRHVINNTGTPAKPDQELDIYIFSLFNENRKPGMESERNWGLFYPSGTSVYNLDFSGKGVTEMGSGGNASNSTGPSWCIASSNATEADMQNGLNWACGPGNVDCTAIQPSQPCYEPDTLVSHASYAFNNYYQQNGATDVACSFRGAGVIVTKDPSYDKCLYLSSGRTNTSSASNVTASVSMGITIQNLSTFMALIPTSLLLYLLLSFV